MIKATLGNEADNDISEMQTKFQIETAILLQKAFLIRGMSILKLTFPTERDHQLMVSDEKLTYLSKAETSFQKGLAILEASCAGETYASIKQEFMDRLNEVRMLKEAIEEQSSVSSYSYKPAGSEDNDISIESSISHSINKKDFRVRNMTKRTHDNNSKMKSNQMFTGGSSQWDTFSPNNKNKSSKFQVTKIPQMISSGSRHRTISQREVEADAENRTVSKGLNFTLKPPLSQKQLGSGGLESKGGVSVPQPQNLHVHSPQPAAHSADLNKHEDEEASKGIAQINSEAIASSPVEPHEKKRLTRPPKLNINEQSEHDPLEEKAHDPKMFDLLSPPKLRNRESAILNNQKSLDVRLLNDDKTPAKSHLSDRLESLKREKEMLQRELQGDTNYITPESMTEYLNSQLKKLGLNMGEIQSLQGAPSPLAYHNQSVDLYNRAPNNSFVLGGSLDYASQKQRLLYNQQMLSSRMIIPAQPTLGWHQSVTPPQQQNNWEMLPVQNVAQSTPQIRITAPNHLPRGAEELPPSELKKLRSFQRKKSSMQNAGPSGLSVVVSQGQISEDASSNMHPTKENIILNQNENENMSMYEEQDPRDRGVQSIEALDAHNAPMPYASQKGGDSVIQSSICLSQQSNVPAKFRNSLRRVSRKSIVPSAAQAEQIGGALSAFANQVQKGMIQVQQGDDLPLENDEFDMTEEIIMPHQLTLRNYRGYEKAKYKPSKN